MLMKFLAFTDVHEDKEVLKDLLERASQKDIDFVVSLRRHFYFRERLEI